jgi:hypothetical protein
MPKQHRTCTIARTSRRVGALRGGVVSACVLALGAIVPVSAGATGSYAGETLSLKQTSPAAVGAVTNFEAGGQQTDVESYAGGFDLQVFYKPVSVDPTCAASYSGEYSSWGADLADEFHPVVGLWQGAASSFSVPFKIKFEKAGQMLVCAYSEWLTDTAAAAQLTVEVAGGSSGNPGPAPNPTPTPSSTPSTNPATVVRPAVTSKPRVTRSGKKLVCSLGTWTNSPTTYSYGWLSNGRRLSADRARTLALNKRLRGHRVQCSVTASNAAGHTTALSPAYRVH